MKDALDKIEEQESSGHRKRRTTKNGVVEVENSVKPANKARPSEKDLPKKVRPKALPPEASLSFEQILKLAATKQHEPVKLEKKVDIPDEKRGPESERLMTKKEKEDLLRRKQEERDRQLRKEGKLPPVVPSSSVALQSKSKEKTPALKVIPSKEPVKALQSSNGKVVKPNSCPTPSASKTIVRSDEVKDPKLSDIKRAEALKAIQNKPKPPPGKNQMLPPAKRLSNPQGSRMPEGKGKTLVPPARTSRPFPPYRDIRPVDRSYKSIF